MYCAHKNRVSDAYCYDGTVDSLKEFIQKYPRVVVENFINENNVQTEMVKVNVPYSRGRAKFLLKPGDYIIHKKGTQYFQFISKEEFVKHYLIVGGGDNGKYENQLDDELQKSTASVECSGGDRQGRYGIATGSDMAVGPVA